MSFEWLGRTPYAAMLSRMENHVEAIANAQADDILWGCEHDPVYTTGRRGIDNRIKQSLDAPFVHTERGGETTFHGPGQLMLYPVIRLGKMGVRAYTHALEQSCIDVLHTQCSIGAWRKKGFPGVWTQQGKIAAMGLRIRRGIVFHGMALNIHVDLRWFDAIQPCGLASPVTSVEALHGQTLPLPEMAERWAGYLACMIHESP